MKTPLKHRELTVLGILAGLGLLVAFLVGRHPTAEGALVPPLLTTARLGDLQRIQYRDEQRTIDVLRREPKRFWVTIVARDADGGLKTRETPLSERGMGALTRFAPLRAVRELGVLPKEKLAELGLEPPTASLEIIASGSTQAFVAAPPGIGVVGGYLMDDSGRVYLVDRELLTALTSNPARLVERRLHEFPTDEVEAVEVRVGTASHRYQWNAAAGMFVDARGARAPKMTSWLERLWSVLGGIDVLGLGEYPPNGFPVPLFRLEYGLKENREAWLSIGRDTTGKLWAQSDTSANWVLLPDEFDIFVDELTSGAVLKD